MTKREPFVPYSEPTPSDLSEFEGLPSNPEILEERSLIVSLVGPTASGKSTLTESLTKELEEQGISSAVINKDDAIRKISRERFGEGKEWRGYTPLRGFGEDVVNEEINRQLNEQVAKSKVIFLEGGTRTRHAAATTLKNTEDKADYVIVKLDVSPSEVRHRLAERRRSSGRIDDHLALAAFKLIGQYTRPLFVESPKAGDPDVEVVNANESAESVISNVLSLIKVRLGTQ